MTEPAAVLVWCPFPDRESAREAAGLLLDRKLIGCANIVGDIESIFDWNGERCAETEIGVLFKATSDTSAEVVGVLGECHPYDTPAIIAWRCDETHPATLTWLLRQAGGEKA